MAAQQGNGLTPTTGAEPSRGEQTGMRRGSGRGSLLTRSCGGDAGGGSNPQAGAVRGLLRQGPWPLLVEKVRRHRQATATGRLIQAASRQGRKCSGGTATWELPERQLGHGRSVEPAAMEAQRVNSEKEGESAAEELRRGMAHPRRLAQLQGVIETRPGG
ncbi:hypothetical protein TRIUR3_32993 [Triticum urartu]|uniref:Uncharacterized protein n=1 Tax=Triticum urartu TaxID=4572 RepID=M7Z8X7_TRIUA|nr:hypothetical protein TRIUR3_32993 [Triticum urartu]